MAVELGVGVISLIPSARGFGQRLNRELSGPLAQEGRRAGERTSDEFDSGFSANMGRIGRRAAAAFGVAFGAAATFGIRAAADFQQTRIAFEGILGSADEAQRRLTELRDFAATTPFEFPDLADAARNLLAVGFAADEIIPTMTTIGNVAAGLGVGADGIRSVVRALGQMRGKGKASAEELQQISEAVPGFSAIEAIAEDLGITVAEAFEEVAKGAVPADRAIRAILRGMEEFPGAAGAMERQSLTLNGVISTFKDTITNALVDGIEPFLPAISTAMLGAIPHVERFVDVAVGGVAGAVRGIGTLGGIVSDIVDELSRGSIPAGVAVELGKIVGLAEDSPAVDALASAFERVAELGRGVFDAVTGFAQFAAGELVAGLGVARDAWGQYASAGVGPVADALDRIQTMREAVLTFFTEQRDILIPAAAAAATFAGAIIAYSQAMQALSVAGSVAQALGPAIGQLLGPLLATGPVGLAIIAVLALAAAFAAAYVEIQPFRDAVDSLIDVVANVGGAALEAARTAIEGIATGISSAVASVSGGVSAAASAASDGLAAGFSGVAGIVRRNVIDPLRPLARFISREVVPTFTAAGELLVVIFERVGEIAQPIVRTIVEELQLFAGVMSDAVGPALDIIGTAIESFFDIARTVFGNVVGVLIPAVSGAFDAFKHATDIVFGAVTAILSIFLETARGIFETVTGLLRGDFGQAWEGIATIIGAPFGAARDFIVNTVDEVVSFFTELPGRIGDLAGALFGGFLEDVQAILGGAQEVAYSILNSLVDFVSGLPGRIGDAASGMWDGIAEAFEDVLNWIIRGWNSLEFTIPGFDPPGPGPSFGGFTLGVPDIPTVEFATGGIVTSPVLGMIGEGRHDEAVLPLSAQGLRPFAAAMADVMPGGVGAGATVQLIGEPDQMLRRWLERHFGAIVDDRLTSRSWALAAS